jgi:trimethylamine--corrinoid protein Co-methyltransferase
MNRICSNDIQYNSAFARKMSDQQCEKLYWGALEVLERVGVRLFDEEAIDLLGTAGVPTEDGNLVKIPHGLVEKAFSTVPRKINMYDRNGNKAMTLGGHNTYFGTGSDCLDILDHRTNIRRQAVLQDIVEGMRIADALEYINFVMCMFLPSDVNQNILDLYEMETMLNNTTKPIVYVNPGFEGCVAAVKMAEIVVGGEEALRRRPMAACYINVTTGLRHNDDALQKLLYLSGKGLPYTYIPSAQGGTTAPITVAACAAIVHAGTLTGLVLSQLQREGAPFIMPGWSGQQLDMKTTVQPYADPEKRGQGIDFSHFLNLPMFNIAGVSDSKAMDQQAAAEAALTIFTDAIFGGNLCHDVGYLDAGLLGSLPQLVICDEIISWVSAFMKGTEVNDETLCIDLIEKIGPDGQYIADRHTLENFKKRWYPGLFDRGNKEKWEAKGSKTLGERATDRVEEILENHQPEPLLADKAKAIRAMVESAEAKSI